MKWPYEFKVWPGQDDDLIPGRVFLEVGIFKTQKAMQDYAASLDGSRADRKQVACYLSYKKDCKPHKNLWGAFLFSEGRLDPITTAHEAVHAAVDMLKKKGQDFSKIGRGRHVADCLEEHLAELTGSVNQQICQGIVELDRLLLKEKR